MTDPAQPGTRTFTDHVADYAQAGWPCIIPVPPETKTPPPAGFTGADGRDTDALQLVAWAGSHASHSIALRMPADVIGIDVDEYAKTSTLPDGTTKTVTKHGAVTLAEHLDLWGPLPATWTSTARDPGGPSRIYFFRVPPQRYATKLTGTATGDVEVIQRHHRYAVVSPSAHPGAGEGALYRWYDPSGAVSDAPPKPNELPDLPATWVQGLLEGATDQGPLSADRASGSTLLDQLLEDWRPECADITSARLQAIDELQRADAGSRHDTMTARVHHLVQLAAQGHTGVAAALNEMRVVWAHLTAGEDRAEELERMLLTSARKAVSVVGVTQVPRDPCLFEHVMAMPGPAPGDESGEGDPTPIEPPRWWSVREFIGVHAFDPNAGTDQALAEKVLERTWPVLRHTYDTGGWLLRVPEQWEPHGRLSPWAVAQVANLMPVGDPTAEKGSDPFERSKRRARLMSTAGARGVAAKMDDLVAGGTHPVALRLADLDTDPEVLWAGGQPWSLRASVEVLTLAPIDPATPHMHAAGVAPEVRPTPLWDAFLAAVWPDPELRAWALRVLAVAVTGYADRALPILLGETGRGKTQVVHLLMSVLGSYAHAANPKLLTAGANEHDTIVFALKGRRLSFIDEAPSEAKAGQERLKQLTGGGELTARQMNQDPITFPPTHTFVLTANDEPLLTDPAVRARARLIPCEGDPELVRSTRAAIGHPHSPQWRAEAPGVLATLMTEASAWLAEPRTASTDAAPERIRYLAEHLGAEQDPVSVWVSEETEPYDDGTASRELYQAFTASCLRNNLRRDQIPSETKWGRALSRLGYPSVHTEHGKRRQLRLRSGGVMPVSGPPSAGFAATPADGLTPTADGFLTGSQPNPSGVKPQVNPTDQPNPDGLTGSSPPYAHAHTRPRAGEPEPGFLSTRQREPVETPPDLRKQAPDGLSEPTGQAALVDSRGVTAPKPPRKAKPRVVDEGAAAKRAALAAEKRAVAIAAASGPSVTLPAVVTRDGAVRSGALADIDALLSTLHAELTVDVETSGYPVGHRDFALRTVQLGNEHLAAVLDPHDPGQADVVRRHLAAAAILHAHSATADLIPLAVNDLLDLEDAWLRMDDTVITAKLADPDSTGSDPGLKKIARAMLAAGALSPDADEARKALFKAGKWLTDTEVTTAVERSGWAQVDSGCETMVRYAASDVLDDAAIARLLPKPPVGILERERTTQRMVARIAHRGIRVDAEQVDRLHVEHTEARAAHAERVRSFGIDNPGSGPQVAQALAELGVNLPRTDAGNLSVAAAVLDSLRGLEGPAGELVAEVLDYRHHNTALTLFLDPYQALVQRGDGRARPTVYTLGADTGRMSCVRPNLQQVSREGGMRACFTADPGHLLISADFAGVELRVAAALSGDHGLAEIMADPERDLHYEVARLAFGPQATKADRYRVKRGVFGRLYGGGVPAVAAGVGVTHTVAQSVIEAMDAITPVLSEWSRRVADGVKVGRTKFPAYSGRVIHLPKGSPHAGANYCIQGTARELLVDALMRWSRTRWGEATLFPVHDELVVMVPEDQAEAATAALVDVMTTELYGVPIIAEASTPSYAWSDSA